MLIGLVFGIGRCGDDEVFEDFDLVGLGKGRIDAHALHFALAVERDGDEPAAGFAFDFGN